MSNKYTDNDLILAGSSNISPNTGQLLDIPQFGGSTVNKTNNNDLTHDELRLIEQLKKRIFVI